eukprot:scaffold1727_cov133-Cylindrotheca_fusiformis.AAC.47
MLAADKLQLQSAFKQQATALKEKEFNLHHSNLMTVGTQAAVLAGLDITMFIEFQPPDNITWGDDLKWFPRILKFVYYITIVSAFCANMIVVSHTTSLSVFGAGMALRGPDGSMMTATDSLYDERNAVFKTFGVGLACTVGSVLTCVWLILHWESAVVCMGIAIFTCRTIFVNYNRALRRFAFDESQTVDFRDIMEGPAANQRVSWKPMGQVLPSGLIISAPDTDDDVEWQQESKHLMGQNDIKRRGNLAKSPTSGERANSYLTTI